MPEALKAPPFSVPLRNTCTKSGAGGDAEQSRTGTGAGLTPQNLQLTVQGGFSGNTVFPPFTSPIKYSAIKVNGAVFSTLNPGGSEEVDSSNKLEIKTSALSAAGDSFTLKYVSNT